MQVRPPHARLPGKTAVGWTIVWFFLHLAVVYAIVNFGTPWLAGWTRGRLLPLILGRTPSSSQFEFLSSHLLAFSFVPAFLTALVNARFKHRVAQFVWLVPTAILAYKFATFPAPSVLQNQLSASFHQYFEGGFLIGEFRSWDDLRSLYSNPDMARCIAQFFYTAPFYAGVGYSLGAWIGFRTELHRKIAEKVDSMGTDEVGQNS